PLPITRAPGRKVDSDLLHELDDTSLELRRAFKEERHRDLYDVRDMLQPARADAVRALLVFLDLLKRQAQCVAEIRLAHCQHHPAHAQTTADVLVDGIWGILADGIHYPFRIEKSTLLG